MVVLGLGVFSLLHHVVTTFPLRTIAIYSHASLGVAATGSDDGVLGCLLFPKVGMCSLWFLLILYWWSLKLAVVPGLGMCLPPHAGGTLPLGAMVTYSMISWGLLGIAKALGLEVCSLRLHIGAALSLAPSQAMTTHSCASLEVTGLLVMPGLRVCLLLRCAFPLALSPSFTCYACY